MSWRDFEEICKDYLNATYGVKDKIQFIRMGSEDSTVSDIKTNINGVTKFYIEAKMSESQCGQFVLLPNPETRKFVFSPRNHSIETPTTKKIIEYMDKNYDTFADGSGVLDMDEQIFYDWVIEHYKSLDAKYVITGYKDEFFIFPIRNFSKYFDIDGIYRPKNSGSHPLTNKQQEQVINLLKTTKTNFSYKIIDDGLIVNGDGLRKGSRFEIDNNLYWLAEHQDGFRVRKLSKTRNKNVIFSIALKKFSQDPSDLTEFISDLN